MPIVIDTANVPPSQRIDYWQRRVGDAFGLEYGVEPLAGVPFQARLTCYPIGAISISEVVAAPFLTRRVGDGQRNCVFVVVQLDGHCLLRQAGQEARVPVGSFALALSREPAEFRFEAPTRHLVLAIPENRLTAICPDWHKSLAAPIPCGSGEGAIFLRHLESVWQERDTLAGSRAQAIADCTLALLGSALAAWAEARHAVGSRMESFHKARIRQFIDAELGNSELDISLIARTVGLSARYIHRLFADEPLHLMQWVWVQRLERCYRELVQDRAARRPVSEIAYAWGFSDPAHFSRTFRKHFGIAPTQVRGRGSQADPVNGHAAAMGTFRQAFLHS